MTKERNIRYAVLLLWLARIWASITLTFILFFLLSHIYDSLVLGEQQGRGLVSFSDILLFLCFPFGTIIGLGLAYKRELWGGLIACGSLFLMFVLQVIFLSNHQDITIGTLVVFLQESSIFLLFILPPGLFYLIYGTIGQNHNA